MNPVFCLVDCDCFYVSAERLFDPTLIYGWGSIRLAVEPPIPQWRMKRDYLSDSYVTDWNQLKRLFVRLEHLWSRT